MIQTELSTILHQNPSISLLLLLCDSISNLTNDPSSPSSPGSPGSSGRVDGSSVIRDKRLAWLLLCENIDWIYYAFFFLARRDHPSNPSNPGNPGNRGHESSGRERERERKDRVQKVLGLLGFFFDAGYTYIYISIYIGLIGLSGLLGHIYIYSSVDVIFIFTIIINNPNYPW